MTTEDLLNKSSGKTGQGWSSVPVILQRAIPIVAGEIYWFDSQTMPLGIFHESCGMIRKHRLIVEQSRSECGQVPDFQLGRKALACSQSLLEYRQRDWSPISRHQDKYCALVSEVVEVNGYDPDRDEFDLRPVLSSGRAVMSVHLEPEARDLNGIRLHPPELRGIGSHCDSGAKPHKQRETTTDNNCKECLHPGLSGLAPPQESRLRCVCR